MSPVSMRDPIREPYVAGAFYPSSSAKCEELLRQCLSSKDATGEGARPVVSAIVPHAGWVYSGPTAGLVFKAVEAGGGAVTFILFGAVHVADIDRPSIYARGAWRIPAGDVAVDEDLATALLAGCGDLLVEDPEAHREEHSLEVQVPFIRHLFPEARIIPIMVPPSAEAAELGHLVARIVAGEGGGRRVVTIGSSDLTHYGPNYRFMPAGLGPKSLEWVKLGNDKRILDMTVAMRENEIVEEALSSHNACGPGAMAAACGFALEAGVRAGRVLGYTTSYDVMPERQPTSFVGYSAIVFEG